MQEYTCKKAKRLAVVFVRYALIVTGTFDGGITKLGTLQFFFIISFIFNNLEVFQIIYVVNILYYSSERNSP